MNVHHLELFYYVARYGGITAAVRKMPYGIQQPAVSGQMLQLERDLGVTLFCRRPFALTPEGEALFAYAEPFFSRMDDVEAELRGEAGARLRVVAASLVLGKHLPRVFEMLRERVPGLRLSLRALGVEPVEDLLLAQEVDVALGVVSGTLPAGVKVVPLLKLPVVLLAPEGLGVKAFEKLVCDGSVAHPLVAMPGTEVLAQLFQKHLGKLGVRWETHVEVGSLEMVESYVVGGFGLGLSVRMPGAKLPDGVVELGVKGCPPLQIGLMTAGKVKPVAREFAELVKAAAMGIGR